MDTKKNEGLDLNSMNAARQKAIEEEMAKGTLSVMTECAYGTSVGNMELDRKIETNKK